MNYYIDISQHNYQRLLKLVPELWTLELGESIKSSALGFIDLNLDVLKKEKEEMIIALSHYYKHPSGDMIPDPDIEIQVFQDGVDGGWIDVLTYQDIYGFQQVYPDQIRRDGYNPDLKKSLNKFLSTWLNNCLDQGHKLIKKTPIDE